MGKRVFISKNASEIEPYRSQFDELGLTVINHSFLSFYPVESDIEQDFDVVFFGSPRAVIFFRAGFFMPEGTLIACVGGKTAELLESLGHEVAFVGTKSGDPKAVAEEFKLWLTSTSLSPKVLFPVSDRSLRSISSEIDDEQKIEVVVYSTEVVGKVVEECDVYVFTSPSNVEGFFIKNTIPVNAEVIAWGKSTEWALVEKGIIDVVTVLEKSGIGEVLVYLKKKYL